MTRWTLTREGWWRSTISPEEVEKLGQRRLRIQRQLGEYERTRAPERRGWTDDKDGVGDVGEYSFDDWMSQTGVDYTWHDDEDDQLTEPDFTVAGTTVGVKTWQVTKGQFRSGYDVIFSAKNVDRRTERHFFFVAYEPASGTVLLLGGLPRPKFLTLARFHDAGEQLSNGGCAPNDGFYLCENELPRATVWLAACARQRIEAKLAGTPA